MLVIELTQAIPELPQALDVIIVLLGKAVPPLFIVEGQELRETKKVGIGEYASALLVRLVEVVAFLW